MQRWNFYTTNELKPRGWLKRQLQIQAAGLSGNLDKIWPDVRDSAWIGGSREGWERVPYWLDGFIPLAYLLEDADMIARAKRYIDAILASQKEDGWICPCADEERGTYDTWAVLLISKVLTVYYDCSRDEQIPGALYRVMKNYYDLLKSGSIRLFDWGKFRWFEGFIAIDFLRSRYQEDWLTELAEMLKAQGADYREFTKTWERPLNKWTFHTHIVNLAMMLKSEAVSHDILKADYTDLAEALYRHLKAYNGTPVETFTGDECLSGLSPIQGTELCSVVEQMYSYELLYAATGDEKWAERLEVLAFNALPAAISADMWTHQYVQQSNQIACEVFPGKSLFRTNNSEAHLFGLEPNFGCCTANFNQGWPKFALSAFLHRDNTVISAVMLPSQLNTEGFTIRLDTEYPFKNKAVYTIESKSDLNFRIRIPTFAQNLRIDGAPFSGEPEFSIPAGDRREITLTFETAPYFEARPHGLTTVKMGSLVFSLPIAHEKKMLEYEKDGAARKFPYCDYELIPSAPWNYGFSGKALTVQERDVTDVPFSEAQPPVVVKARLRQIDWGYEDGYETVCAKLPQSTLPISQEEEITLYPYGCAKLRMTEMPFVE